MKKILITTTLMSILFFVASILHASSQEKKTLRGVTKSSHVKAKKAKKAPVAFTLPGIIIS
jgi:hypothetical protein